ncbi:MAG TPA: FkbM family methyltransferase [Gemmatimonadaceae bacterium]|jgi:FkbM family methyltransferase|nr:FkbM family methyltransferase [Gemmatimonadaceae bacterium]
MVKKLVFDVGFNIGQDTAFYLSRGHRVVAIEADPELAEAGRTRFHRDIETGNLEILNVGIAQQEGSAEFWICEAKPEFNSFHQGIAARDGYATHSIRIPTTRFGSVLRRFGTPYFLKIDIEGNEMLCLDDLNSHSLPKYLSIESECPVDENPISVADGLRVLHKLRDLGYQRFKLIDQFTFCSITVPASFDSIIDSASRRWLMRPPLSRVRGAHRLSQRLITKSKLERSLKWEFPVGSSGAIGEDTAGDWINHEDAERAYRQHREKYFQGSDVAHHSFWCDWHAKLSCAAS